MGENKKFVVDINPIYSGEKHSIDFSYRFLPEKIRQDILFEEEALIFGRIFEKTGGRTQNESYIELDISINALYKTFCARCSKEINETLALSLTFCVVSQLQNEENDDYIMAKNGIVEIDSLGEMLISLNLPFRSLCISDCKGLCTGCGANLNYEICTCKKDNFDPRLAILKKLLDKDEN